MTAKREQPVNRDTSAQALYVLAITTAYEQGFGHAFRLELSNPYPVGEATHTAWDYGREEGQRKCPQHFTPTARDALIDKKLAEYGYPANSANAGRAGWYAALDAHGIPHAQAKGVL